jgi:hypothetical protein
MARTRASCARSSASRPSWPAARILRASRPGLLGNHALEQRAPLIGRSHVCHTLPPGIGTGRRPAPASASSTVPVRRPTRKGYSAVMPRLSIASLSVTSGARLAPQRLP